MKGRTQTVQNTQLCYIRHKKGEGFFLPGKVIVIRAQESRAESVPEHRGGAAAAAAGGDTCVGTVLSAGLCWSSESHLSTAQMDPSPERAWLQHGSDSRT